MTAGSDMTRTKRSLSNGSVKDVCKSCKWKDGKGVGEAALRDYVRHT